MTTPKSGILVAKNKLRVRGSRYPVEYVLFELPEKRFSQKMVTQNLLVVVEL
jgi:hypothetical protein